MQWCNTRVRQCTRVDESIFLGLELGLGCKGLALGLKTWGLRLGLEPSGLTLRLGALETYDAVIYYFLHWDSMFKKIQWTLSIFFSQLQLFSVPTLWMYVSTTRYYGSSVVLSRLHISQSDIEATDCTYNCSMQVEHVFRSGEIFTWAGQGSQTSWVLL